MIIRDSEFSFRYYKVVTDTGYKSCKYSDAIIRTIGIPKIGDKAVCLNCRKIHFILPTHKYERTDNPEALVFENTNLNGL